MSFAGAIMSVPQLGHMCGRILLDEFQTPGSGLKVMRLVSKQMSVAVLGLVQGYTLALNGLGAGMMEEIALLQDTRLCRLRVVVSHDSTGSPNIVVSYTNQIRDFIWAMSSAIKCVSELDVHVSQWQGSADDISVVLSRLARACPALQKLLVDGDISRCLLAAFGSHCHSLFSLTVLSDVSDDVLQNLHLVLPVLTHVDAYLSFPYSIDSYCPPFLSCSTLGSLDVHRSSFTSPMWQAIPPGLKELSCCVGQHPPAGVLMKSLEHLRTYESVPVSLLVGILQVAPNLKRLTVAGGLSNPSSDCSIAEVHSSGYISDISDVVYLHKRVSSGLSVLSLTDMVGDADLQGVNIKLCLRADEGEFSDLAAFLATFPSLPAFTSLVLESTRVEDISAIALGISSTFPNLTSLALDLISTTNMHYFKDFKLFTGLQFLYLENMDVSIASISALCTHLPVLQKIFLNNCGAFKYADGLELHSLLVAWGSAASVECFAQQ